MDFSKLYTNPLLKATMAVASGIVARDGGKRIIHRMSHLKGFSGISLGSLWDWEVVAVGDTHGRRDRTHSHRTQSSKRYFRPRSFRKVPCRCSL